ncbi:hypothetical protein [Fructilactobacillus cliffordii]|uniref:Uncharacterized protein n=1 Tax=Fructilactobacillus cliffordii TaxID=2940299 RepID=A0A9Q9E3N5_9LACO|nr:hypothetical protein [Fructilactobacillus cliffordii]USS89977.1 hypothetical protein M3M40_07255 [Fructilactobacillus cliffordii]
MKKFLRGLKMSRSEVIKVSGIPIEVKQKLIWIAKENGFDNLSQFLRSQFKQIASSGVPIGRTQPIQLQLNRLLTGQEALTKAINENNRIYSEDKQYLKNILGLDDGR